MTAAACPQFAEFVERGVTSGRQLLGLAEAYLAPLNAAGVDTLVLGCTHYPMLTGLLSVVMGEQVTLVSSAEETAKDVYRVLLSNDLLRPDDAPPPQHVFRATGDDRLVRPPRIAVPRSRARRGVGRVRRCWHVKLTVLGCSGSVPGPDSPASGYLVEADGFRLVLDWGTGRSGRCSATSSPARSTRC